MTDVLMWYLVLTGALATILLVIMLAQSVGAVAVRARHALRSRQVPHLLHGREPHAS